MCDAYGYVWVGQGDALLTNSPEILNKNAIEVFHEACVPLKFSLEVTMGYVIFIFHMPWGHVSLLSCRMGFEWVEN